MRCLKPHCKAGVRILDIMSVSHRPGKRLVGCSLAELQLDLFGPTCVEEMRNRSSVHFYLFVLLCRVLVVNVCSIGAFSREEAVHKFCPVCDILVLRVLQNFSEQVSQVAANRAVDLQRNNH